MCYFPLSILKPKRILLQTHRFDFFAGKFNRFSHFCMRRFDWIFLQYDLCFNILIDRKNQKLLVLKKYLNIDNLIMRLYQLDFVYENHNAKVFFVRANSIVKIFILFLASNFCSSNGTKISLCQFLDCSIETKLLLIPDFLFGETIVC